MPGPVPKREKHRRRNNPPDRPVEHAPGAANVEIPEIKKSWHPVAKRWFEALTQSGQRIYYEPSDWAQAYLVAETMSRELKPRHLGFIDEIVDGPDGKIVIQKAYSASMPISGGSLTAILKAMTNLLVTEGDRRRARLELDRPDPTVGEDNVSWIDTARERRSG